MEVSVGDIREQGSYLQSLGAIRHGLVNEAKALVNLLKIPYFTTAMSKGFSEDITGLYGGIYGGGASPEDVKQGVEGSDLVMIIGHYPVCACCNRGLRNLC